jgi:hypothetical protein
MDAEEEQARKKDEREQAKAEKEKAKAEKTKKEKPAEPEKKTVKPKGPIGKPTNKLAPSSFEKNAEKEMPFGSKKSEKEDPLKIAERRVKE